MVLTAALFIVEIIVGYVTNSMALVADSFHMLSDLASLVVGYMASKVARVGTKTERYSFGWARAEVLGALVNAVFLIALCFSILVEAVKRIIIPEELKDARLVLIAGGVGLFVNIIGLFLFHQHGHGHSHGGHSPHCHEKCKSTEDIHITKNGHSDPLNQNVDVIDKATQLPLLNVEQNYELETHVAAVSNPNRDHDVHADDTGLDIANIDVVIEVDKPSENIRLDSLNVRGVYLHVLGDALGSVIVLISGLIVLYVKTEWTEYVDPSLSIILVLIILKTSFPLLKESSLILMQTVPTHIKMKEIKDKLVESVPGVLSVHEFHIWQLVGNKIIASAHVRCEMTINYMSIASKVKEFFHNEGIHSTTIQLEFVDSTGEDSTCLLECEEVCSRKTCCGHATSSIKVTPNDGRNINGPEDE